MRLCRFSTASSPVPRAAVLEGETLFPLDGCFLEGIPPRTGERVALRDARLLAPVTPSKVICVGLNYRAHALEMGKPLPEVPLIFLKPPSAVVGPGDAVVLPPESRRVDHEAELGIVMGRRCRRLARGEALGAVRGYTCVNDVTARDIQRSDVQYTRGKGFDTFCPLGPWVETDLDPHAVVVRARVNGQVRQEGNSSDLIHGVEDLLVFISGVMTLLPGDVIATGTPPGVGPLAPGDVVEVEVGGVGVLRNAVT